jgi:hypothetical protein
MTRSPGLENHRNRERLLRESRAFPGLGRTAEADRRKGIGNHQIQARAERPEGGLQVQDQDSPADPRFRTHVPGGFPDPQGELSKETQRKNRASIPPYPRRKLRKQMKKGKEAAKF